MPKALDDLIAAKEYPHHVEQAVRESIAKEGTADKIVLGHLVLPTVDDATRHAEAERAKTGQPVTPLEVKQSELIAALESKIDKLTKE